MKSKLQLLWEQWQNGGPPKPPTLAEVIAREKQPKRQHPKQKQRRMQKQKAQPFYAKGWILVAGQIVKRTAKHVRFFKAAKPAFKSQRPVILQGGAFEMNRRRH